MGKIILILLLLLISCSITENEDAYFYDQWASVENVEIEPNNNGSLALRILLGVGNPCYVYDKRVVSRIDDTVYVRYYSKIKGDAVCIEVLSSLEVNDIFKLESNKTYFFRFWQIGETNLDTLIFIK